jgi:hypothetical protein
MNGHGKEVISLETRIARERAVTIEQRLIAHGCPKAIAKRCQALADAAEKRNADPVAKRKAAEAKQDAANIDKANKIAAQVIADKIALGI